MEVGVLGPLSVRLRGEPLAVTGTRLRALLIRLALDPGRRVSIAELAAAVWSDDLPADPANALQSLVSRLRRALGQPGLVSQHPGGYQLEISRADLDATAFVDGVAAGRTLLRRGELTAAGDALTEALALWRGPALVDAPAADYVSGYAARWEDLRLDAVSELMAIALRQGRSAEVIGELEAVAAAHPLRESFTVQLMTALAASGRTAEALERYEQTRTFLAEQLGTDPGPELRDLHLALLRGEADLPSAPPTGAGRRRTNLRSGLTSFVGRADELSRVSALIEAGRLTTIVGPGGAGKTRLAAEAARAWLERSGDPVWLVELAPVTSEANLAPTILSALGIRDVRLLDRQDRLLQNEEDRLFDALADTRCLLVLDNCEHLIDAVAKLVDDILGRAAEVRILATSREPLAITGESLCSIPPLTLPSLGSSLADAARSPAVTLWLDRARAVRPDFALDEDNVAVVTDILRRLDGLPLAIELAAARLRVLPLDEIARRLSDRFRLLTGGNRTSLPRHRTLRAVVEWSWDLLSPVERLLAERLAVFPAGASVQTAIEVCADARLPADAIEDLLNSLVDKSLLQTTQTTPVRYRMLETIREYGVERLTERSEVHAVRTAHADYFAGLAARLEPSLHDATQLTALETLNTERDNIIAALRYYGDSGRPADALTLGLALVWYWSLLGSNGECSYWMDFVVEANADQDNPQLVYAEVARTVARASSGEAALDWPGLQEEGLRILARLADAPEPPFASLTALGPVVAIFAGRPDLASAQIDKAVRSPHRWVRAAVHGWSASLGENDGDVERVRREADLAFAEFSAIGDRWGLSTALSAKAHLATLEGDLDAAIDHYETALRYVTELGSTDDDLYLLIRLTGLYSRKGDTGAARQQLRRLQERSATLPVAAERELFTQALEAGVLWQEGRREESLELTAQLRRRVADKGPPSPLQGHALAVILATAAIISAGTGDVDAALTDVATAYPAAVATADMPIIAAVGVAVAHVAEARSLPSAAAEILGAAGQVRGAEDLTDREIRALYDRLSASLGDAFLPAYRLGNGLSREEAIARLDPALLIGGTPQA